MFGGGFLEKATKRIEEEKLLAKVIGAGLKPPPAKHRRKDNKDPNDLRRFLENGASARYGSRNPGHRQPYPQKRQVRLQRTMLHTSSGQRAINSCTHQFTIYNSVLFPIPSVSNLPTAGWLPHCLQNWQKITADQWVFQVAWGYNLELLAT